MNARSKKLLSVLAFVVIGVGGFVAKKSFFPSEPVYDGKPLSAWAQQYGSNYWTTNRATTKEAETAIRQIGTEGIPFLLDCTRARDSSLRKKLRAVLPEQWHARLNLRENAGTTRRTGAHGLAALGTNAPSAVPALIEIAANHPDVDGRYIAVFALRTLGSAAEPAIPFFVQCLTNNDSTICDEAATALGIIHQQPELVVPALIQYLESVKTSSRGWPIPGAVYAFREFGTNARPVVPILVSMLNHSGAHVREAVTNCLPMIDAETAAKEQVKRLW